jgi:hypothetical protein
MDVELTEIWSSADCSSGPTCPAEAAAAYPDGRRTRIRVGRRVTDPDILARLNIGPDEVANEVDEGYLL